MAKRVTWLALLCASASSFALSGGAASAQENGASNNDEIVVTARRTEERLQDVPGAVTAFSQDRLDQLGASDTTGLQGAVPNLNIVQGRGSSNATNIFIRGVGQPDALQTFDPAVGFYVDGVYYSRIRGTQIELFDLQRVEVLRGPQGTLYGKNTIGGALSLVTRLPGQDPHGMAQVTAGDYGLIQTRLSASGPLSDTFAVGASLFGTDRDGYVTNPVTHEQYNDRQAWGARLQAAWNPTSTFNADISIDYQQEDNALTMGQAQNTLTNILGTPIYVVPTPTPPWNFQAQASPGLPNSSELTHSGVALHANWDIGNNWELRSISAYRRLNYTDYIDIDGTPVQLGDVLVHVDQNQVSQELQAVYSGDRLTLVGGLYYLREDVASHQEAFANDYIKPFFGLTSFRRTVDDDLTTTSEAAYINANYALSDRLHIGLGVRYTDEHKDYPRSTSTFFSNPLFNTTFAFHVDDSWQNTSPMASVDYRLNDDVMLYARVARGFQSGGFNGRANALGEEAPYAPETLTSYEVGAKTQWMDNRLIANLAVFYNAYEDFQARVGGTVEDPVLHIPVAVLSVLNAGRLDISGAELELNYHPIEPLRLDAEIGYLDASYGEFNDSRFPGGSRAFQTPAFSPDWTMRFGGVYTWDLPNNASLVFAADANYRSRMALAVDDTFVIGNVGTTTEIPGMFQDAYWLFNASVTWHINDVLSIGVQGRNLGDEVYKTDAQEFSSVGQVRTAYFGAPRTLNVVLTAHY
jgi:iron complex outermembrane receptor protein